MKSNIDYNFVEDLNVFKAVADYNDKDIIEHFSIPKSSLYRYYKNKSIPSKDILENTYNSIYKQGVALSKIYEDVYKTERQ